MGLGGEYYAPTNNPRKRGPVPTVQKAGGGGRAVLDWRGKSRPHRDFIPGPSSLQQVAIQTSYRGSRGPPNLLLVLYSTGARGSPYRGSSRRAKFTTHLQPALELRMSGAVPLFLCMPPPLALVTSIVPCSAGSLTAVLTL